MNRKLWVIIGVLLLGVLGIVMFGWFFPVLTSWIAMLFLIVFPIWLILSINIVGPDEMAVKVYFGVPKSVCDSGFRFVPFLPGLKVFLQRYPKKIYNLDYPNREVISEAKDDFGNQVLIVNSTAYIRFPRPDEVGGDLIKILKSGIPTNEEALKNWTEESVISSLRMVLGKTSWQEAVQKPEEIKTETEKLFRGVDGILIKAGFRQDDLRFVIEEIKLPSGLESVLPKIDQARIGAQAAEKELVQEALKSGGVHGEIRKRLIDDYGYTKIKAEEVASDLVKYFQGTKTGQLVDIRLPQGSEGSIVSLAAQIVAATRAIQQVLKEKTGGLEKNSGKEEKKENTKEDVQKKIEKAKKKLHEEQEKKRKKK